MKNDMSKKIENILKDIDKSTINSSQKGLEQFLSTEEGQKLIAGLGNIDKTKLLNNLMNMNSSDIKAKLQNADLSKLSGINADEILKKLR